MTQIHFYQDSFTDAIHPEYPVNPVHFFNDETAASGSGLLMQWQDVCEHPHLQNLPFKIELNEWGQILMSPVKVYHSAFQGRIARLLPDHGAILAECAIKTSKGTKVADVAWASRQRFTRIQGETECSIAPEICIEVISASNTEGEMEEKRRLYIESGALEFWVCNASGEMAFFDAHDELTRSNLIASFPKTIEIAV